MNRRTLPALTALATATTLLLTACGGESPKADEKIPGAGESSAEASASPSEKESGADAIDRPEMKFPGDMKVVLDWSQPSGADQAAALHDAGEYMTAVNFGIDKQDPED
ncbi:lipoprotein, partial [Streptomyces sp. NRRL F-6602]